MPPRFRLRRLAAAVLALATGAAANACNVPVFRYALERWQSDAYQFLVLHKGPLSEADAARINTWRDESIAGSGRCNFQVTLADLAEESSAPLREVWKSQSQPDSSLPWVMLRAPLRRDAPVIVWAGKLSDADPSQLLDSPARRELVKRLSGGESAVWVLVKSGKSGDDAEASEVLSSTLRQLEKEISLPPGIGEPGSEVSSELPLKIKFSVLDVARGDPAERTFVQMLFGGQAGISETNGPAAFVLFGRARVLGGIGAEELTPELVTDASAMLCGPCSCQMKEMNPGYDLLVRADWDGLVTGQYAGPEEMPPLKGFSEFVAAARAGDPAPESQAAPTPAPTPSPRRTLVRAVAALIVLIFVFLAAASAFILRPKKR